MDSVGEKIRKLRFDHKKRQADIAKALGISIPAFSKIESGITDVNVSRLRQIADLFEVHPASFFQDDYREVKPVTAADWEQKVMSLEVIQEKLIRAMAENHTMIRYLLNL